MTGTFYKGLGFVVWKGGKWYARRRWDAAPKRRATGLLSAGAVCAGLLLALRRNAHAGHAA